MTKGERLGILRQIADRIVIARDISGMTQHQLAQRSGISRTQIANLETGRSDLPAVTLIQLARALGVKPGKLLP